MVNKGLIATVAATALATVGLVSQAHASEEQLPGSPIITVPNPDPFALSFDEAGNASYKVWNGSSYGSPIQLMPIPGAAFLTWQLPQPVILGNVAINEPGMAGCQSATTCSDGLGFSSSNGNYFMSFFSLATDVPHMPADTGFPAGFFPAFNGPAEDAITGAFQYVAGPGDPNLTNFYNGVSPQEAIPEASTWAMMLLGFAGIGFAAYRRAKVSLSAA
jgi:hypothetical protein